MNNIIKTLSVVKTFKFWKELIVMTLGMMVTAAAVYYFLVPSKLIIGTISGLSIVLCNIFGAMGWEVKLSVLIAVINAVLLILAYILVDHEFGIKTVYTAMILGPLTDVWDKIMPWTSIAVPNSVTGATSVMGDPWLDLCCFVLLLSASQALMFSINASTGGLDILAKIVNKYLHFDIGASVSIAGAVICCTAFFINDFRMVVIGLIGTWINGIVVDYFTATLNNKKRICIVSQDYDRIRQFIINDLHRGCTMYEVIGGYTGEKSIELVSLLTKDEFSKLMSFLKDNNIHSFTTAGNVSEVYGLWLKNSHRNAIRSSADSR
ncbi:MAG: YitT family protein [Bacteroidales bacterium]|nr:YitT family protein [Bacteroidales bacterium]